MTQLDLFADTRVGQDLPPWFPERGPGSPIADDPIFPREELPRVEHALGWFTIQLRPIEGGVVCWGVDVQSTREHKGPALVSKCFLPNRHLGPRFAAMGREAAVQAATEYAVCWLETEGGR